MGSLKEVSGLTPFCVLRAWRTKVFIELKKHKHILLHNRSQDLEQYTEWNGMHLKYTCSELKNNEIKKVYKRVPRSTFQERTGGTMSRILQCYVLTCSTWPLASAGESYTPSRVHLKNHSSREPTSLSTLFSDLHQGSIVLTGCTVFSLL